MADLKLTEGFTETKTLGEIQVLEPGKPLRRVTTCDAGRAAVY